MAQRRLAHGGAQAVGRQPGGNAGDHGLEPAQVRVLQRSGPERRLGIEDGLVVAVQALGQARGGVRLGPIPRVRDDPAEAHPEVLCPVLELIPAGDLSSLQRQTMSGVMRNLEQPEAGERRQDGQ